MDSIYLIAAGGFVLFLLLVFQVLLGLRKIRFKGALHMKVHKWTAYAMLALGAFHGLFAAGTLVFGWF